MSARSAGLGARLPSGIGWIALAALHRRIMPCPLATHPPPCSLLTLTWITCGWTESAWAVM